MGYSINSKVEYKGYTLTKKGQSHWTVSKDEDYGYTTSLKKAKEMVDRKLGKEDKQ